MQQLSEARPTDQAGHLIEDPYNPSAHLFELAMPGDEGIQQAQILAVRDDFKHANKLILDEMLRLISDIAQERKIPVQDLNDDGFGAGSTPKTSYSESLQGDGPNVDDDTIRKEARQHDADTPSVDEQAIRQSAADEQEFRRTDEHLTHYEKLEDHGIGDAAYFASLDDESSDIRRYYKLCRQLKGAYDATLGTCIEPAGVVPGGKK